MEPTFARDLGYLDKFLAGLAKHADTLPPDRGGRLKALMAEEVARWDEIKRLLAGEAPNGTPTPPSAAAPAAPAAPVLEGGAAAQRREGASAVASPPSLTIGSLIGVPKK